MKKLLMIGVLAASLAAPMWADPCGMVPPVSLDGEEQVIERVGEQKTYVFRKGDLQTVVIHPGFEGNVDEFGMLIPFPTVPALRKMPDNVFEQLTMAVEPPTIDYWVRRPMPAGATRSAASPSLELRSESKTDDQVVVLKEEAVGMYEVAVLEAGSAAALKRWMTDHNYRFPDGMESACNDYVKDGWCFVAVKTRVGSKAGVDPKPGMRSTTPDKPKDASFSGKVQAMGFRFRSDNFVVPMRLSAFNGGDFHNIVYVLAEEPVRASNLPVDFVQVQLDGKELYSHLKDPLPYRILGGTEDDMSPNDWKTLNNQRDPEPYNGVAAQLFAHDVLAYQQSELSHDFEEREKLLLDIGERLNLRGGRMDVFHDKLLAAEREEAQASAMESLKEMSFTVIEGDFPPDVVANENIRFEPYRLKSTAQESSVLSAALERVQGESEWSFGGIETTRGLIEDLDNPEKSVQARKELVGRGSSAYPYLLAHLRNPEAALVSRGYALVLLNEAGFRDLDSDLERLALDDPSELMQLWARAALVSRAGSAAQILELFQPGSATLEDYKGQAVMTTPMPELQRPIALKLQNWTRDLSVEQQLRFLHLDTLLGQALSAPYVRGGGVQHVPRPSPVSPSIKQVVSPTLKNASSAELTKLMFASAYQEVRQLAAGLLASRAQEKPDQILSLVIEELSLGGNDKTVPWEGGALFIPQFNSLTKSQATELIGAMVRWSIWIEVNDAPDRHNQPLENNLRSYCLWSRADSKVEDWRQAKGVSAWLQAYSKIAGPQAARRLLEEQKVNRDSDLWKAVR